MCSAVASSTSANVFRAPCMRRAAPTAALAGPWSIELQLRRGCLSRSSSRAGAVLLRHRWGMPRALREASLTSDLVIGLAPSEIIPASRCRVCAAIRWVTSSRSARSSTARCSRRRRVRLHDADARPIAKRRLGQLVEFGYKVQVTGNDDGIILGHDRNTKSGRCPQVAPADQRVMTRRGPRTVTADRGCGEKRAENDLDDLGLRPAAKFTS
jgi:hypothetical protein